MSLKAFHVVFITASVLMTFAVAAFELRAYQTSGRLTDLALALGSGVAGMVLLVYGRYFLRKLKNISYL